MNADSRRGVPEALLAEEVDRSRHPILRGMSPKYLPLARFGKPNTGVIPANLPLLGRRLAGFPPI